MGQILKNGYYKYYFSLIYLIYNNEECVGLSQICKILFRIKNNYIYIDIDINTH